MPTLVTLCFTPLLFLLSLPLISFAFLTTTLAFSTLLIRVLIVYAELFAAVLQNQLHLSSTSSSINRAPSPSSTPLVRRNKSHRNSDASTAGSMTPRLPPSVVHNVYNATPLVRDFEGVGGWRFPDTNDTNEEAMWTRMNARLELPFTPPPPLCAAVLGERKRKHERSLTSSSLTYERPLSRRGLSHRSRPVSAFVSGTVSPEDVLREFVGKSRTVMGLEQVGTMGRKSSSSSQGSSVKTSQYTGGDGG